jgi:hypothetical protein
MVVRGSRKDGAMLRYNRLAAIALIAISMTTAASAAQTCASRPDFIAFLKGHFGEVEVGQGLSSRGHLVEIFVSPAGNWTILLSQPNGRACLVDAGEAWAMVPPARPAIQHLPLALPR